MSSEGRKSTLAGVGPAELNPPIEATTPVAAVEASPPPAPAVPAPEPGPVVSPASPIVPAAPATLPAQPNKPRAPTGTTLSPDGVKTQAMTAAKLPYMQEALKQRRRNRQIMRAVAVASLLLALVALVLALLRAARAI